jgi:RTA1 like protein
VIFVIFLAAHLIQTITKRTWYFLPLAFGCVMEIVGYSARSLSAKRDPYHITYFVLQYFFIVTAPVFITASIYVCLNKLIAWAGGIGFNPDARRWLRPRFILWGFVFCDVVSTIMQVAGAALIGSAESNRKDPRTPNNILLAGLAFQSFAFVCFIIILCTFVGSLVSDRNIGSRLGGIRPFITALMIASVFILLRLTFRLAETAEGVFGYLMVHEAFFGALEFAPVVLAVGILAVWHPGRWIPPALATHNTRKEAPTMEGVV